MNTKQIIQSINWDDIFGNSSQFENLGDLLADKIDINQFIVGFYPRCHNKKIAKHLTNKKLKYFKFHAKKLWKLSNVYKFSDGCESLNREQYIDSL